MHQLPVVLTEDEYSLLRTIQTRSSTASLNEDEYSLLRTIQTRSSTASLRTHIHNSGLFNPGVKLLVWLEDEFSRFLDYFISNSYFSPTIQDYNYYNPGNMN